MIIWWGLNGYARGILAGISIDYLKKARGTLIGECRCAPPDSHQRREYLIDGEIRDGDDEVVAKVTAKWLIGPIVD